MRRSNLAQSEFLCFVTLKGEGRRFKHRLPALLDCFQNVLSLDGLDAFDFFLKLKLLSLEFL